MLCDICNSVVDGLSQSMHIAAMSAALTSAPAQDGAATAIGAFVIANVTVIDVERGEALPGRWVRIDDGLIERIETISSANLLEGAEIIRADGQFLIPGLFDAHVHYTPAPDSYGPLLVAHGVTCVRDLGAMTEAIISLREQSRTTDIVAPDIICTGAIIDGDPPVWPFSEPCDTEAEARVAVNKLHKAGVNQIKVYSLLKPEVYQAAVDEAHKLGLKAVGHVPDEVSFDEVIAAKQNSLEHLMGIEKLLLDITGDAITDEDRTHPWPSFRGYLNYEKADKAKLHDGLKRLKEANVAVCPTVSVIAGIARVGADDAETDANLQYVPAHMRAFWDNLAYASFAEANRLVLPTFIALVGELHRAGVTLLVGTDLANAYVFAGSAVHQEMAYFAEAGVPAADVLRAATIAPAKFCEVDDKLGSIAPGKTASLVLLRENPLADIGNISEIERVFLRGRHFDRAALDQEKAKVRAAVQGSQPKDEAITLELPGNVLHRGRFKMRFQTFDAGVEDFLITETDEGFHVQAHLQPQGSPLQPCVVTAHANTDGVIQAAEYKLLTQSGTTVRYDRAEDEFVAQAPSPTGEPEVQSFPIDEKSVLATPVTATEFCSYRAMELDVGEAREIDSVSFGFQGWQLVKMPAKIMRLPDEKAALPDGKEVTARVYVASYSSGMGEMTVSSWVHPSGLPIRTLLKLPFGEAETKLESLE